MSRSPALFAAAFCLLAIAACDEGPKTSGKATPGATGGAKYGATGATTPGAATPGAATAGAATAAGATFGAGVELETSTPISTILADPKAFAGKSLRVEGMVVDVCPKRGCWMDLAGSGPGEKLKFKVVDGEMTFPMDAKGKYAVAEGVLSVKELSLEDSVEYAKYQAEEVGKTFDPASVTAPISVVKLDGTGAVLRDRL